MKRLFFYFVLPALLAIAPAAEADELADKVDSIVTGALGPQNDAERYCRNIADMAKEAKFEWQVKTIDELEEALAIRTEALEAKRAEVEDWLKKREAFMAMARTGWWRSTARCARMRPRPRSSSSARFRRQHC